jgi:hypothetical protein
MSPDDAWLLDVVDQPEALGGLGRGSRLSGDLLRVWVLGYLGLAQRR